MQKIFTKKVFTKKDDDKNNNLKAWSIFRIKSSLEKIEINNKLKVKEASLCSLMIYLNKLQS